MFYSMFSYFFVGFSVFIGNVKMRDFALFENIFKNV